MKHARIYTISDLFVRELKMNSFSVDTFQSFFQERLNPKCTVYADTASFTLGSHLLVLLHSSLFEAPVPKTEPSLPTQFQQNNPHNPRTQFQSLLLHR